MTWSLQYRVVGLQSQLHYIIYMYLKETANTTIISNLSQTVSITSTYYQYYIFHGLFYLLKKRLRVYIRKCSFMLGNNQTNFDSLLTHFKAINIIIYYSHTIRPEVGPTLLYLTERREWRPTGRARPVSLTRARSVWL